MYGHTALSYAAYGSFTKFTRALVNYGAKVDHVDDNGDTALVTAYDNGQWDNARILIDAEADLEIKNKAGMTALMVASDSSECGYNPAAIMEVMLKAGASVDSVNEESGNTALHYACNDVGYNSGYSNVSKREASLARVKLLFQYWADEKQVNNKGETALIILKRSLRESELDSLLALKPFSSLQKLCREIIRSQIPLASDVHKLELPTVLEQYLIYR